MPLEVVLAVDAELDADAIAPDAEFWNLLSAAEAAVLAAALRAGKDESRF